MHMRVEVYNLTTKSVEFLPLHFVCETVTDQLYISTDIKSMEVFNEHCLFHQGIHLLSCHGTRKSIPELLLPGKENGKRGR